MKKIFEFDNQLTELILVKRPSKYIKSPYVADAKDLNGIHYLVHVPCMGLADQCLNGSKILAIPSTKGSKTDFIAQAVYFKDVNEKRNVMIGANPQTAELICKHLILNDIWNPFKEKKFIAKPKKLDYRADLYFEENNNITVVEVKNVVCASSDPKNGINDKKNKFYDYRKPFVRAGVYPFGNTNQSYKGNKVVSKRSIRQIDFMIKNKNKFQFAIIFIINRGDCGIFKPCWKADPFYAKTLMSANQSGIAVYAIKIRWKPNGCYFDRELEIDFEKW